MNLKKLLGCTAALSLAFALNTGSKVWGQLSATNSVTTPVSTAQTPATLVAKKKKRKSKPLHVSQLPVAPVPTTLTANPPGKTLSAAPLSISTPSVKSAAATQ